MKVLIIDDNPTHLESAKLTLQDHDLTLISSFEDTVKHLMEYLYGDLKDSSLYEAILIDLLMPMWANALTRDAYRKGEEVPYGFPLMLMAVGHGAKYIGLMTDTNHHHNANVHALGFTKRLHKSYFMIDQARVLIENAQFVDMPGCCPTCNGVGGHGKCFHCNGLGRISRDGFPDFCPVCFKCPGTGIGKCRACDATGKKRGKNWGALLAKLLMD